jgi:hypothetical protein
MTTNSECSQPNGHVFLKKNLVDRKSGKVHDFEKKSDVHLDMKNK